jgi:hypothetical protein
MKGNGDWGFSEWLMLGIVVLFLAGVVYMACWLHAHPCLKERSFQVEVEQCTWPGEKGRCLLWEKRMETRSECVQREGVDE